MAKVGEILNDGADFIKWELAYAQGLQYEMIYWQKRDYICLPEKGNVKRGGDEKLSDVLSE